MYSGAVARATALAGYCSDSVSSMAREGETAGFSSSKGLPKAFEPR